MLCSHQAHEKRKRRLKKGLPETTHLTIGVKVVVTDSWRVDLSITNGAHDTIVGLLSGDGPLLVEEMFSRITFPTGMRPGQAGPYLRGYTYARGE